MIFDGLPTDPEPKTTLEVLNATLDKVNINMKTRLTVEQQRVDSWQFYLKLCKTTIAEKYDDQGNIISPARKLTSYECFSMAMRYIKQIRVSTDDDKNRVLKVIDGVRGSETSYNMTPAPMNSPIIPGGMK